MLVFSLIFLQEFVEKNFGVNYIPLLHTGNGIYYSKDYAMQLLPQLALETLTIKGRLGN